MQGINASLLHLTTPENENKGQDKHSANEDEDSLFCLSLVQKNSNFIEVYSPAEHLEQLNTINDMELHVQQNMQQDMALHMPSQQQYGHAIFQNRWLQQPNNSHFFIL